MKRSVLLPHWLYLFFCISIAASSSSILHGAESSFLQKGLEYYKNQQFEMAAASLEEAKKIHPDNPKIYFYLGNCYYQLNELDNAIRVYTRGLNATQNKGPFFYNLGNCYYLKNNYTFAGKMYSKAISSDSSLVDSHLNAGNAYYKAGEYTSTILQWETYLNKNPDTPQYAEIEKAIAYLKQKMEQKQQAEQEEIIKKQQEEQLLQDVMKELDEVTKSTKNIMESSKPAVDDLSIEEIER